MRNTILIRMIGYRATEEHFIREEKWYWICMLGYTKGEVISRTHIIHITYKYIIQLLYVSHNNGASWKYITIV